MALLEQFGGELSRTALQKLLFLYCKRNDDAVYEFVPYQYGCYSFQAAADQQKLAAAGFLHDTEKWRLVPRSTRHVDRLSRTEKDALWSLKNDFGRLSQRELVRHVYTAYPYYASRSRIAREYLSKSEQERVISSAPPVSGTLVCSIGYEGLALESYLNKLLHNDIKVVCDVRRNPLSRKFGFSKTMLRTALGHLGIEYRHFPQLGIASEKRCKLESQTGYDALFDEYESTTLIDAGRDVEAITELLEQRQRIALLCFERLACQCHRTRVLNAVLANIDQDIPVSNE